jgi:hypothetical protein
MPLGAGFATKGDTWARLWFNGSSFIKRSFNEASIRRLGFGSGVA